MPTLTKRQRVGVALLVPLVLVEAWALTTIARRQRVDPTASPPVTRTLHHGSFVVALPPAREGLALDVVQNGQPVTTIALTPFFGTERARAFLIASREDDDGTVRAEVGVRAGAREVTGTLTLSFRDALALRWDDAPDVAFEARLAGPFAALVDPGHQPIVDGPAEGAHLVALGRGYGVALPPGSAALRDGAIVLANRTSFDLGLGSSGDVLGAALGQSGFPVSRYGGSVAPVGSASVILALGDDGAVVGVGTPDASGSFSIATASGEPRLFASLDGTRIGPVVTAREGDTTRLVAAPLGAIRVTVRDVDTGSALPSRVVIHGIEGTREPNFGPHFRATGAGPILDTENGSVATPLPAGRYRVSAFRGLEYTVDVREVELRAGDRATVDLGLRHVVKTPGLAGCDFHVHSRAGFDSEVTMTDRVRSLAAVGVDFAVPSEHNEVGSYRAAADVGLDAWLGWVPGVEVTTAEPLRGHFNLFPYDHPQVPPFLHSSLQRILKFAKRVSPDSVVQINHPRLEHGIGYFNVAALDPETLKSSKPIPEQYDTLEVYNGFDIGKRDRTEANVEEWIKLFEAGRAHWATGDSDSHTVQYGWAGFPRTYVAVAADHDGGAGPPVDAAALIDSLKQGRAFVTSGPIVELSQGGRGPGGLLEVVGGRARVHLRVRAAPWIDVSDVSILVGGHEAFRRELASIPPRFGVAKTAEEDERAALRFEDDVEIAVPPGARTVVAVARARKVPDEAMPFMGFLPIAFTNPLVVR